MLYLISTAIFLVGITACQTPKNIQSKAIKTDTLNPGYMYWANDFTPFGFGSRYTLIVKGTVINIQDPTEVSEDAIYIPVEGTIIIDEVILDSKLHGKDFNNIGYITTDCFHGSSIIEGNQVLVFCVSYEGDYAITGKQSIIQIPKDDKRYITSLKKYIHASYDPNIIEKDIDLWNKTSAGEALKNYLKDYKEYNKD